MYIISFQAHGIGKPMEEISPRGPNLKLRKRYRQMIENELEFDRLAAGNDSMEDGDDAYTPNGNIDEVRPLLWYLDLLRVL